MSTSPAADFADDPRGSGHPGDRKAPEEPSPRAATDPETEAASPPFKPALVSTGDAVDPDRIGPYKLLEVLGQGGMGTVYVAEQLEPIRRRVALKIIKLGMDTREVVARFESEQQALSILNHPNIASVLDAGTTPQGRPFFVMEYVPGDTVTAHCDREQLSTDERLELFIPVCEAVQHAHQKGIIHRDLKPSNLLVMIQDGKPLPKIIDFGIAKATSGLRLTDLTLHTAVGQLIGTPEYMSPEQAGTSSVDIDTRADVYSLGVILYELLVGALPFDPETLRKGGYAEIQRIIREQEPPKPSAKLTTLGGSEAAARRRNTDVRSLERRLKGDLDWIVMKCLEKNRTRRYESAAQLADDIQRHLRDDPVLAGPPSLIYQLRKFARRNRPAVLACGAVVIALLVGLGTGTGGALVAATVVVALLLIGFSVSTVLLRRAQIARRGEARARELAEEQRQLAEEKEHIAEEQRELAERQRRLTEEARRSEARQRRVADERYHELIRLSDIKRLRELEERAKRLWPAVPERVHDLEAWLRDARALAAHAVDHHDALESLRKEALPLAQEDARRDRDEGPIPETHRDKTEQLEELDSRIAEFESELETHEEPTIPPQQETGPHTLTRAEKAARLEAMKRWRARVSNEMTELEPLIGERRTWRFETAEDQWRHDVLGELVVGIEAFAHPDTGTIATVESRIQFAESLEERSVSSPDARGRWSEAIADIAQLPVYAGLALKPQLGLLPLSRDRRSGLWEFWCVGSGGQPEPNPDPEAMSPWLIEETTGMILVLVPGGTFTMGAQAEDPDSPNHDPHASENEGPPHEVTLEPFFASRYLMTQGQWQVITGTEPSQFGPFFNYGGKQHDLTHPVERVSWVDCREVLERLGLELPTEAQWEYAARAGTTTPWWTGADKESLAGAANLADRFAQHNGGSHWRIEEWLFDGYVVHSPVGHFRPNGFGLHDVHGNVWEWCRDRYGRYAGHEHRPGHGELIVPGARLRPSRGGSHVLPAISSRVSTRTPLAPELRHNVLGVRPARSIVP